MGVALPDSATDELLWMPAGVQDVTCKAVQTGAAHKGRVLVNKESAAQVQKQFELLCAKSAHRPYFDLNHDDAEASFWPREFFFREGQGIIARGEYTSAGRTALEGKTYRAFSPRFWADTSKSPSPIVCNPDAKLNMGGMVNDPAFKSIEPFFAKQGPDDNNNPNDTMKKTVAELQAKITELEKTITGLKAKPAGDDKTISFELAAKEAEVAQTRAEIQAKQAEDRAAAAEQQVKDMNRKVAKTGIEAAIKRGAIPAQNKELQAKWEEDIVADPTRMTMLEALQGNAALAVTEFTTDSKGGGDNRTELVAGEGLNRTLKGVAEICAKNGKVPYSEAGSAREKGKLARQVGLIYRKEFAGKNLPDMIAALRELVAADFSNANLGVLTGTLVAQRTLELFKYRLPMIKRITTDFSELPAELNQDINTRIVTVLPTMAYDPTVNNQTGLANGWAFNTAAQTTNVKITMNQLIGVPIRFGLDVLSETARRLFDEQAPAAMYALAKAVVETIYGLMTPANFNAYAAVNGVFVPTAYATYIRAKVDFGRSSLVDIEQAFDSNQVPQEDRTMLLIPSFHGALENDPSLVTFFAGQQAPEIIEEGALPNIAGFKPLKAPDLAAQNATANISGFAMQKTAIVMAQRLPVNLNEILPGASFGAVSTVTDPDTDISVQLVQYVNQTNGFAEWRIQTIFGGAVGDNRGGIVTTSA